MFNVSAPAGRWCILGGGESGGGGAEAAAAGSRKLAGPAALLGAAAAVAVAIRLPGGNTFRAPRSPQSSDVFIWSVTRLLDTAATGAAACGSPKLQLLQAGSVEDSTCLVLWLRC